MFTNITLGPIWPYNNFEFVAYLGYWTSKQSKKFFTLPHNDCIAARAFEVKHPRQHSLSRVIVPTFTLQHKGDNPFSFTAYVSKY
jgi:hypothetical protein